MARTPAKSNLSKKSRKMPRHPRRDLDLEGSDPRIVTTLARGLRVLRAFHAHDEQPLGNKELAERTGLAKATVSRLTYTLTQLGFLSQDARSGAYALAAGVLAPAYTFLSRLDIRRVARPYMQKLAIQPGVTVSLATRHELRMTAIESVVAESVVPHAGLFGGRAPIARTAIGHAYLAGLKPDAREQLMAELRDHYAGDWATIGPRIQRDIRTIERKGYCVVLGEWTPSISGVAVPIVVDDDGLVLSMSAGGPAKLLSADLLEELGIMLRDVRRELERAVGRPIRE
ncbi:IclR family transcriptional regulator [Vineibacter terrae]|uniref:IclR family transcriptional regulator n=2 Tax=Vineibacter terrae TaxID=2586908 RepID=A0A5C8PCY5_9HYPH|nr:IclR family transcriptional regulator [Vineibacter terrae]